MAAPMRALVGSDPARNPLSAQARAPSRPSGDDKEQETAKNEGSAGSGRGGRPSNRCVGAHRHARCPRHRPQASRRTV